MRGPSPRTAEHARASAIHSSVTFAHSNAHPCSIANTNTIAGREAQR